MSKRDEDKDILEGKVIAILSYLPVLCIIPLVLKKENPFVLYHGRQGLVIFTAEVGVFVFSIPFSWILPVGMFVLLLISFIGIIAVLKGQYVEFPLVTKLAQKITL
ncbi:MAG: hypothetical protein Q8Q08_07920 [Candidatus Omnitrophota bacterium]|nr:hypothetical protein [Candidatus Omnitrophota bacterium]MDZ4243104.1 hypothetical protein [Candidatus Omnitrophota bacterium]